LEKGRKLNLGLIAGLLATLAFVVSCTTAGGETGSEQGTIWPMIIFLALLFAMVYFLMIRPQRRRQKEQQQMMAELQKGDRVITAGGVYGDIESVYEDSIVLKVESGTTIRVTRNAIISKLSK